MSNTKNKPETLKEIEHYLNQILDNAEEASGGVYLEREKIIGRLTNFINKHYISREEVADKLLSTCGLMYASQEKRDSGWNRAVLAVDFIHKRFTDSLKQNTHDKHTKTK